MNEFALNTLNIASIGLALLALLVCLLVWFFLNRASVRANEQVLLLNELLEQQKKQTEILMRLGQGGKTTEDDTKTVPDGDPTLFKDFIAER
jgi:uncharacterized membrane protein